MKNLTEKQYRKHKNLNASTLKHFLNDYGRRFEAVEDEPYNGNRFEPLRFGSAYHMAILEPHQYKKVLKLPEDLNLRTKDGRQQRDNALASGRLFVYHDEALQIKEMADALDIPGSHTAQLRKNLADLELQVEQSYIGEIDGVPAKARMDIVNTKTDCIMDLKSCQSAHPVEFCRHAVNLNYDLAAAWYLDLYENVTGVKPKAFGFIAQEKEKPFLCNFIAFVNDGRFIEKGREKYRQAMGNYFEYKDGYLGYTGNQLDGDDYLPAWY